MKVTIQTLVKSDLATVWSAWSNPEDIKQWNAASDDWHTTSSTVDLREGGSFTARMEAKDQSFGFDFGGTYTRVEPQKRIEFVMDDQRTVEVAFTQQPGGVLVTETFDAETHNDVEMQRRGWQAILDNFARHVQGSTAPPETMPEALPPLPATPTGRYRHYKGGEYEVIGAARHSETLEALVVYRPLYNESGWWVRPHAMFFGQLEVDGRLQARFARIE